IPQNASRVSKMDTKIIKIKALDDKSVRELEYAANVIKSGGLVVFPTETVYGLGGDAEREGSVKKIYAAKGRPSDNPLIIHVADAESAEKYAYTTETYYRLAKQFMPGPITVIMPSKNTVPLATRGGLDTVAVRCPQNPIAIRLISLSGTAIAAPSANLSGTPSPTSASHVIHDMTGRVDVIIDGGECDIGIESTIVKLDGEGSVTLLRPGKITVDELLSVVDEVKIADAVTDELKDGEIAESPGMKYKHYAPKAELMLLDGERLELVSFIKKSSEENIAVIAYSEDIPALSGIIPKENIYDFGSYLDKSMQAQRLFDILRRTDRVNYSRIYAPLPERTGIGLALYNRMIRAAAHKILNLRR
ncbi:MAG: threonylcarbamoyl-AMP synthase, partial [Clostridia bacterium]|nr:threonylcarbamoyl-AMP synthase [Clostridia bacterium]